MRFGNIPRHSAGIEWIERADGTGQFHPRQHRQHILLGVVNQRAMTEPFADAWQDRLHEQPLQERLARTSGPDQGQMRVSAFRRNAKPPQVQAGIVGGPALFQQGVGFTDGAKASAAKVSSSDLLSPTSKHCGDQREAHGDCKHHAHAG